MGTGQDSGFIVLHRRLRHSWLWALPGPQFKITIGIILAANWRDEVWNDGIRDVTIRRGQFITSQEKLALDSGVTRKIVRSLLVSLRARKFITLRTSRGQRYTLITVIKYDTYQNLVAETVHSGPDSGPRERSLRDGDRATSEPPTIQTIEPNTTGATPSPVSSDLPLFQNGEDQPNGTPPATSGSHATAVTRRIIEYINRTAGRRLTAKAYTANVRRVLSAGATEIELKLVVWHAVEKFKAGKYDRTNVNPGTLFKLKPPPNYPDARAWPQYLAEATEAWELGGNGLVAELTSEDILK